jgi:hypothetical protein
MSSKCVDLANRNLAINSILGAAFGGALWSFHNLHSFSSIHQLLVSVAWLSLLVRPLHILLKAEEFDRRVQLCWLELQETSSRSSSSVPAS